VTTPRTQSASSLIQQTIDDLLIDAAFLRLQSRSSDDSNAPVLKQASEQIGRLTARLERLIRGGEN